MLQLILIVKDREVPTSIYFKRQETYEMWVKHHYLTLAALIDVLCNTKTFDVVSRRIK